MPNMPTWSNSAARGLVASGIKPGDRIGIFLPNCWEFGVAIHAAMMAGAVPTPMNPTYREREVRYQLETCDAVALVTDGALLSGISLAGLPALRNLFTTRSHCDGSQPFESLLQRALRNHAAQPRPRLAAGAGNDSLLQRHHRTAQGRDADPLQHRRQRLSDADSGRDGRHLRR